MAIFSKRHYEVIAELISLEEYPDKESFIKLFKDDNPKFNEKKFREASASQW